MRWTLCKKLWRIQQLRVVFILVILPVTKHWEQREYQRVKPQHKAALVGGRVVGVVHA